MKTLRSFFIGLLSFLCAIAVSLLIWLIALQATVLQRDVVKGWLRETDVYSKVVGTVITQSPEIPANPLVTPATTEQALQNTFTPAYVQDEAEKVIDTAYDWLDGKQPQLQFSIPVDEKRTTFIEQLATTIQPQVASMPVCTSLAALQSGTCRPPTQTPAQYATTVATQAVAQSDVLARPVTSDSLLASSQSGTVPSESQLFQNLPAFTQAVSWLFVALPILIVASILLIAFFATDRLLALKRLSRRICLGALYSLIAAAILLYFSSGNTLPAIMPTSSTPLVELLTPFLQKAVGSVAQWLALTSASAALISGGLWIAFVLIIRRRSHPKPPIITPQPPTAAAQTL